MSRQSDKEVRQSDEEVRQSDGEVRTARPNKDSKKTKPAATDELMSDKDEQEAKLFAELQEQADAVDKVMTRNGPPEHDWTSG